MSALIKGMVTVAAVLVAAGAGLWAGQTGVIKLPIDAQTAMIGRGAAESRRADHLLPRSQR